MNRDDANLDLVRAMAVLLVVAFHLLLALGFPETIWPIGGWGVYMFFVHTSLVLMYSFERQTRRAAPLALHLRDFMARRCFRILPLSVVVVTAVWLLELPVGHLRDARFVTVPFNAGTVATNLLLIQNVTGHESVMATLWSLPYEMQMYAVLPALFLLARRADALRVLFPLWILACVAGRRVHLDTWQMLRFVPCFLAGVISYRLSKHRRPVLPAAGLPVLVLGLTLAFFLRRTRGVEWVYSLLLATTLPFFRELQWPPLRRLCQLIARYSYGIYLTHFICLWFALQRLGPAPLAVRLVAFVTTGTLLPVALYHLVEKPMIDLGARWIGSRPVPAPVPRPFSPQLAVASQPVRTVRK